MLLPKGSPTVILLNSLLRPQGGEASTRSHKLLVRCHGLDVKEGSIGSVCTVVENAITPPECRGMSMVELEGRCMDSHLEDIPPL
jgi:hypothetical protein